MAKRGRPRKRLTFDELPDIMECKDVAEFLGLSLNTVYNAVHDNRIPALKFGRAYKISKLALRRMLEAGKCWNEMSDEEKSSDVSIVRDLRDIQISSFA